MNGIVNNIFESAFILNTHILYRETEIQSLQKQIADLNSTLAKQTASLASIEPLNKEICDKNKVSYKMHRVPMEMFNIEYLFSDH